MFVKYEEFLVGFDEKLSNYFERDSKMLKCQKGCSLCCSNGDYPLSNLEMRYLMFGFSNLSNEKHELVKANIQKLCQDDVEQSYVCPFLLNNVCAVYAYRPLICRIHGLGYMRDNGVVNLPGCAQYGLNYSENYDGNSVDFEPINEDLSINKIVASQMNIDFGAVRPLISWFKR